MQFLPLFHFLIRHSRYGDKTSTEIAEALQLSRRTVENHLYIGRRDMREFFRKCI